VCFDELGSETLDGGSHNRIVRGLPCSVCDRIHYVKPRESLIHKTIINDVDIVAEFDAADD
jgi:hypothetical protein